MQASSFLFLLFLTCLAPAFVQTQRSPDAIRPWQANPRYWEYRGKPVLLLGGSREDNLFQIPDLESHLDLLARSGGNYVRNTMSSRDEGNAWPFAQRADELYDLETLNPEYFRRFEELLRLADQRGIIVQIELWDRFDFAREPWLANPYRPANNSSYSVEQSGLANEYPNHPGQNDNPFFRSVPSHDNNTMLLRYQQRHVDRLLEISLRYRGVLYCMDNETSATADWGAYWSNYIRSKAARAGVEIQTTEMWDAWDLKNEQHRRTINHPELYSFVDTSQNNHNKDQLHWDNLQWVRELISARPRPLNHVKIYGADTGRYGTDQDALERFWRNIIGGAASARFHRPPSGLGLGEKAQGHLRSARAFLAEFDIFHSIPDAASSRLGDREPDEAYLTCEPGKRYAVYFPSGGRVSLDLRNEAGSFEVRWLNIEKTHWQDGETESEGSTITLATPGSGHWLALVRRRN